MRVKLPSLTSGLEETRSEATEGVDNPITAHRSPLLRSGQDQDTGNLRPGHPLLDRLPQAVHSKPGSNGKVNDNEDEDDDGDEKRKTASKQNLRLRENRITTES